MKISKNEKRLVHVVMALFVFFLFVELRTLNLIELAHGIYFTLAIIVIALIFQYYVKADETKKDCNCLKFEIIIIVLLIIMIINPFFIKCCLADNKEISFKSSCENISYYELNHNFNEYEGKKVIYVGKVEYLKKTGDTSQIILDINNEPNNKITVFYQGNLNINCEESITIYGIILGKREISDIGKFYPVIVAFYVE